MKEVRMSIPAGKPHRAIPPSEILEDFLGEYGITQYRLAKETKIPHATITRIMKNESRITAEIAVRLGLYFGNGAEFWANCQNHYDLYKIILEKGSDIKKSIIPFEKRQMATV